MYFTNRISLELDLKPWLLVFLRSGRKFVHNPETNVSLWTPPEDVQKSIDNVETDELLVLIAKARGLKLEGDKKKKEVEEAPKAPERQIVIVDEEEEEEGDDDEGEIEESDEGQPEEEQESSEGEDLGWLEADVPSEYEQDQDIETKTKEFREMLDSYESVNPYNEWDVEYAKVVDDDRYDVFESTKERKQAFDAWAKNKIAALKIQQQEKPAPKSLSDVSIQTLCNDSFPY